MKRYLLFALALFLSWNALNAADKIKIGDLYYYLDSSTETATVTSPSSGEKYSGNITIPSTVTCESNTYSVTTIGYYAFSGCTGLTSVTIHNSVTSIGESAFQGCTGLTSITIPNSVTSIGWRAFCKCIGLTSITIPNSVTWIYSAFQDCTGLTSITIPNSVTSIGYSAFAGCTGLTSVTIPNSVTSIGSSTFYGCTGLTAISIPNSVTSIGSWAFEGCAGLTSVMIGNSVTSIGDKAFYNCVSLTSITIPNSVTSIGSSTFEGCTGLSNISVPGSVETIEENTFAGCTGLTTVVLEYGIKNLEGRIDGYPSYTKYGAFKGCSSLVSIIIPESVTNIGSCTFCDCTSIPSITIPNSVTSIGSNAFSGCTGLTSITIPNSVTSIGESAFYNCTGLTSVMIGNGVTSIGEYAFLNCTGLTSITIPNSVMSIGNGAFYGCTGLTSVTIPDGVTSIGNKAFRKCTGLTSITIPNSVTSIGWYAFDGCMRLSSITIPNSVTSIKNYAFRDCTSLTSVIIPNNVTSIGESAFLGCTGLSSATIGTSVTSIGERAFDNVNMENVIMLGTIPPTVVADNTFSPNATICVPCEAMDAYLSSSAWALYKKQINGLSFNVDGLSSYVSLSATKGGSARIVSSDCSNNMITIEAIPDSVTDSHGFVKSNFKFVRWNDGNTDNPRTMIITSDINLVAEFAPNQYTISVSAENGQVEGAGIYDYGTYATLQATANEHYHFTQWSDGSTSNPRRVYVTDDATYTAEFAINRYTISATAENGYVEGTGKYDYGTTATLTATANEHYHFTQWSDGNTDNPRTVSVEDNATYVAIFAPNQYTISAISVNGRVEGAGKYDYGTTATLTAVANEHYHFVQWSDGNTDNPRTVSVEGDATYAAEFAVNQYTITATCDAQKGSVFGGGTYGYGSQVTLGAIPNSGYEFKQWSNGLSYNPYRFTVVSDLTLEAEFIPATAIDDIQADKDTTTPQKVLINGQVYILRNGKTYTTTGVEVK